MNAKTKRVSVTASKTKADPAGSQDLEARIRARAFEIFQHRMRCGIPGDAVSDWLQAEREIRAAGTTSRARRTS